MIESIWWEHTCFEGCLCYRMICLWPRSGLRCDFISEVILQFWDWFHAHLEILESVNLGWQRNTFLYIERDALYSIISIYFCWDPVRLVPNSSRNALVYKNDVWIWATINQLVFAMSRAFFHSSTVKYIQSLCFFLANISASTLWMHRKLWIMGVVKLSNSVAHASALDQPRLRAGWRTTNDSI